MQMHDTHSTAFGRHRKHNEHRYGIATPVSLGERSGQMPYRALCVHMGSKAPQVWIPRGRPSPATARCSAVCSNHSWPSTFGSTPKPQRLPSAIPDQPPTGAPTAQPSSPPPSSAPEPSRSKPIPDQPTPQARAEVASSSICGLPGYSAAVTRIAGRALGRVGLVWCLRACPSDRTPFFGPPVMSLVSGWFLPLGLRITSGTINPGQ